MMNQYHLYIIQIIQKKNNEVVFEVYLNLIESTTSQVSWIRNINLEATTLSLQGFVSMTVGFRASTSWSRCQCDVFIYTRVQFFNFYVFVCLFTFLFYDLVVLNRFYIDFILFRPLISIMTRSVNIKVLNRIFTCINLAT